MEFFKFVPGEDRSYLSNGVYINGIRTATWAERYVDAGTFEFRAPERSGLNLFLPPGTIVSHVESQEPMIVETVELDDEAEQEDEWVIKGSSLETYMKHRIIGDNIETYTVPERLVVTFQPYTLTFDTSWAQIVQMITDHMISVFSDTDDEVAGFVPISNQQHIGPPRDPQDRTIKTQSLYDAVKELLAIDDFGIKVVRPNADNVDPAKTEFRIHNGVDRTTDVIFSHVLGDLEKAKYFWSDKALKTEYYCYSTYYRLRSSEGVTGFDRRILAVDCTDMDSWFTEDDLADGVLTANVGELMDIRGQQALRAQKATAILSTDVSKTTRYKYRTDYDVGDIVTVNGNYNLDSIMRVTEYVEFQDENGESGYPTLSPLNE